MSRSFTARQLVTAALAVNALRPFRGRYSDVTAFAAGWLTTELAPQLLTLTAADTVTELTWRRRRGHASPLGLALGAAFLIEGRKPAAEPEETDANTLAA